MALRLEFSFSVFDKPNMKVVAIFLIWLGR